MTNREFYRPDCRGCGRLREPRERFSARGKCELCGEGRMLENARQLQEHSGPYFDSWRRACLAAFGGLDAETLRE